MQPQRPRIPAELPPAAHVSPKVRAFLAGARAVTIGTTGEDGEPHQAVAWYRLEPDDTILLNSRWPRRWPTDLSRDGRCSLAILDHDDPMRWVGIAGVLEERVDDLEQARQDIVDLGVRYGDEDPATVARWRAEQRVTFRVRITRIHDHLGDD